MVDARGQAKGRRVITNKIITAFGKDYIEGQIQDAYAEDRILYVDKKRSHIVAGGTNKRLVSRRDSDFKNNIDAFWANVNYEKGKGRYSLSELD